MTTAQTDFITAASPHATSRVSAATTILPSHFKAGGMVNCSISRGRLLSLLLLCGLLLNCSVVRAELVLHYTFDETNGPALDTGASPAADGTFVNLAARTNDTPNGAGQSLNLDFPGATNYLAGGNPDKLNGLTTITLTLWMNLRAKPNANERLLDKLTTSAGFGWKFVAPPQGALSASNFGLAAHINSTTVTTTGTEGIDADHKWIFFAMTYDGNLADGNLIFYRGSTNISVVQSGQALTRAAGPILDTSNEFRVGGAASTASDRTPSGWYDEVRVYNTVLSQAELELVRQETTPNVYTGAPRIVSSPQSITVPNGADAAFSVSAIGGNLAYQWQVNGVAIPGAISNSLVIPAVLPDLPAAYSVTVSNGFGVTNSADAILTVNGTNLFNTAVMTNIWTLLPGDAFWLTGAGNTARNLAYDASSSSLIVASRSGGNAVVSLDAASGATQFFLDTSIVSGGTLTMDAVAVADDGAVYVANLTINATNIPFTIYRWSTNDPAVAPTIAFSGDPGGTNFPGLRWGDQMAVHGSGASTEILIFPSGGFDPASGGYGTNVVALLRTLDGVDFQNGIPPASIQITNALTGFANVGLTFGPDTNTFFAKNRDFPLVLVQYDPESGVGFIQHTYSANAVPNSVTAIGMDSGRKLLAGLAVETPDNVRLFGFNDQSGDPELIDQEGFEVDNANTTAGGTGSAVFGNGRVFVLDTNNGIKAFQLNPDYVTPAPFRLSELIQPGPAVVLGWPTEPGRIYQAWGNSSADGLAWTKIGLPLYGDGSAAALTNAVPGVQSRFYRVLGQ